MRQTGIDRSGLSRTSALVTLVAIAGCLPDLHEGHHGSSKTHFDDSTPTPTPMEVGPPASAPAFANGPPPELGRTVVQSVPPPPLSGGTLAVAPDGATVVAADPDRDRIYLLDYRAPSTLQTITLAPHDEPGRVAIDGHGQAHVALRGGAALLTIDLATASIVARRPVCAMPRGVAYDPAADLVHVACGGGELVTFPSDGGPELRRRQLTRDLRDVVVVRGGLLVSTFREARVFRLEDGSDEVIERDAPSSPAFGVPRVAWRMIAGPPADGSAADEENILLARQKAPASGDDPSVPVPPPVPAAYYGNDDGPDPCEANGPGPVIEDRTGSTHVPGAVLPVDLAATPRLVAVVAAGNAHTPSLPQLLLLGRQPSASIPSNGTFDCAFGTPIVTAGVQLTSAVFVHGGEQLLALSREPAALLTIDVSTEQEIARVSLAADSREDTGHAIFHSNSGAGAACASCHPDGRDDGHAWRSLDRGARRTPSLLGTLTGTAPYHWDGEAANLDALMQLTFESRMRGPALASDQKSAIGEWLRALPAPARAIAVDPVAAARGKALFEAAGSCVSCHSGVMRTNNANVDVGTGGLFQVPSLVGAAWRAPLLHDGSAPTIRALLERGHGSRPLSAAEQGDVSAYAETF